MVGKGPAPAELQGKAGLEMITVMNSDQAAVLPLHLHLGFQDRQRVKELKTTLMTETLLP
jgi:hypothetical protein